MNNKNIKSWFSLIAIGLFTFMSTLDASIVNIALPTLSKELNVATNNITWIVTVYLIIVSALLILFGRLGDIYGKIKIFKIGTLVFIIGSLLCGINLGFYFLLFSRIIQAIGASMTMSNSFGITSTIFEPARRTRAMSIVGLFVSLGSITGPGLGGIILQFLDWNYIFLINIPIGIIAIILGSILLPKHEVTNKNEKVDLLGSLIFFSMITIFFIAIQIGQNIGFNNLFVYLFFIFSIILFIIFINYERKITYPTIDFKIFNNKVFSISLLSSLLIFMTNFFASILLPFYLQDYLKYEPGKAGIIMMVFPIVMIIFGPIGGYLGDKTNKKRLTATAIIFILIAQIGFIFFNKDTTITYMSIIIGFNALGTAFFQAPNNALVMNNVDKKYLGIAGSFNALARNLGMVLGISLATISLFTTMSIINNMHVTTYLENNPSSFIYGMQVSFIISSIIALIALLCGMTRMMRSK